MVKELSRSGRPPVRQEAERKALIVAAAEQVFDERGYGDATMEEIAHAAGMAKKTVYKHFPDKFALFSALVNSHDDVETARPPASATSDPRDQIRHMLFDLASFILSPRQLRLMRLVISEARKSPELAERFHRECVEDMLTLFIEGLSPDHAVRRLAGEEARLIADMFLGAAIGPLQFRALMLPVEQEDLLTELRKRVDFATDLLFRSL